VWVVSLLPASDGLPLGGRGPPGYGDPLNGMGWGAITTGGGTMAPQGTAGHGIAKACC